VALKVWTDGTDTVIAEDIRDVQKVIEELHGSWESEDDDWGEVKDESEVITIHNFDGNGAVLSKTAGEWIVSEGRGFLCSTEY
jgi:hypothetical protein